MGIITIFLKEDSGIKPGTVQAAAGDRDGQLYHHTAAAIRGSLTPKKLTDCLTSLTHLNPHGREKESATGFWQRAQTFFETHGITVLRVLTDNGSCYRSHAFAQALGPDIKHKFTRPYRPQTNGKSRTVQPHPGHGMGLRETLQKRRSRDR